MPESGILQIDIDFAILIPLSKPTELAEMRTRTVDGNGDDVSGRVTRRLTASGWRFREMRRHCFPGVT